MKWKMKDIILVLIGCFIIYIILKSKRDETKEIFNDPEYAIGTVTWFSEHKPSTIVYWEQKSADIRFVYTIGSIEYEQYYDATTYNIPFKIDVNIGSQYLVIYKENDPEKSRILLDKPISDSLTLNAYKEKLKGKKLDPEYYKKE